MTIPIRAQTATIVRMTPVVAGHAFRRTMTRMRALMVTNVRMTLVAAERVSLRTMTQTHARTVTTAHPIHAYPASARARTKRKAPRATMGSFVRRPMNVTGAAHV